MVNYDGAKHRKGMTMNTETVVRIRAGNAEDACDMVETMLETESSYGYDSAFDYYHDDEINISEEVKTEADFAALRQKEIKTYESFMERALGVPDDDTMKGCYLIWAGESLESEFFWSTQRLAYDYARYRQGDEPEGTIYYVTSKRHY
jgi:hypothetical protein